MFSKIQVLFKDKPWIFTKVFQTTKSYELTNVRLTLFQTHSIFRSLAHVLGNQQVEDSLKKSCFILNIILCNNATTISLLYFVLRLLHFFLMYDGCYISCVVVLNYCDTHVRSTPRLFSKLVWGCDRLVPEKLFIANKVYSS